MFDIPIADIGEPIADLSSLSSSCSGGSSAPSSGEIRDVEATFRIGRLEQSLMFARKKSPNFAILPPVPPAPTAQMTPEAPKALTAPLIEVRARVPVVETRDLAQKVEDGAAQERN